MTPVEERIDGEEAKRIAERHLGTLHMQFPGVCQTCDIARAYLALLTEHSALHREMETLADEWESTDHWPCAVELRARWSAALPATESAQPEEERRG